MSDDTSKTSSKKDEEPTEEAAAYIEQPLKAETASPEPKPLPKEPRKGLYTLGAGDTPGIVSIKFYGRSNKAGELVRANPGCGWQSGDEITLV
jgi:hypothetical protein